MLFLFVNFASAVLDLHAVSFFPSFLWGPQDHSQICDLLEGLRIKKNPYTHGAWCEIQEEAGAHFQVSSFIPSVISYLFSDILSFPLTIFY